VEEAKQINFLELYEPIHTQFSRFCRAIAGNKEDAEDLMNDAILIVLDNMNRLKDINMFKSYLFSIASNQNKMRNRRAKFRASFNDTELKQIADSGNNPEYAIEFKIIYEKILTLPAKISETLILFHISDMSIEEIQKIQGGSLSGVKLRLKRGREKLLASLSSPKQRELAMMLLSF
jgi:RNA polymerase sigma-70 factor (ECF subfamily)